MANLVQYVNLLLDGTEGSQVMERMRAKYINTGTLKTHSSNVRSAVYESGLGRLSEKEVGRIGATFTSSCTICNAAI